jgi:hypothetical protein
MKTPLTLLVLLLSCAAPVGALAQTFTGPVIVMPPPPPPIDVLPVLPPPAPTFMPIVPPPLPPALPLEALPSSR